MSSTNKTTHYELSQYVGSDKPTYLSDYNGDMLKIDTAINTAKTTADSAATAATTAQTSAEGAQTTANTAITNAAAADTKATTANTNIGTLANLTTTAKTDVVSAINEVDSHADTANAEIAKLEGIVVYNNPSGTYTGATISNYKITDYARVLIEYADSEDNESEVQILVSSSGEHAILSSTYINNNNDRIIFNTAKITFTESGTDTVFTISKNGWGYIGFSNGGYSGELLNVIKVKKIIFYEI